MENKFEIVKEKLPLLEYVLKFIKLKQLSNGRYVGLCPFHIEKTASFHVNASENLFYCFGCSRGGDVFSFYSLMNSCDKSKALEDLASFCNINLNNKAQNNQLSILLELLILNDLSESFLKKRGVNDQSIKKFKLGWIPSFVKIESFLKDRKLNYAKFGFKLAFFRIFQNRVVFPIFDEFGKVISFGGRSLDNSLAKYINGADSEYFHKNKTLYGLNFAKHNKKIYLVEGYLDVILMDQYGYFAVGSMGTAISIEQLKLLWRYTDEIIVCFDGDAAGAKASYRTALLALECIQIGKEINFILLQNNDDPASYLFNHGSLSQLNVYPLYEFFLIFEKIPDNPDKKALFYENLFKIAEKIQDLGLRAEYRKKWNANRWKKINIQKNYHYLLKYDKETLVLLLFKYVLCYNQLLDHVAEKFLTLDMNNEFNENLILAVNNQEMNDAFLKKVLNIAYIVPNLSLDQALLEWNKIFEYIQFLNSSEREDRLIENFSIDEWELYKQWIEKKGKINEED